MILWHQKVHEHALGESLAYFQLSFVPVYKRQKISDIIQGVFKEYKISSFCIYEIYGLYDVMIRAWIPLGVGGPRLTSRLSAALEDVGCTRVLPFFVGECVHHWLWWKNAEKQMLEPIDQDVQRLDLKLMHQAQRDKTPDLLEQLARQNLLRQYSNHDSGMLPTDSIKFFTVIPPPMLGVVPSRETENMILKQLRSALLSSPGIIEPSMYVGNGFAWILIKGKADSTHFSKIDGFVQQINEFGAEGYYIRTYTYLVTGSAPPFSIERESLSSISGMSAHGKPHSFSLIQASPEMIRQVLEQEHVETDQFEVKGSLKLKINRYVCEDHHPTERDENVAREGVLKTIVAFLNTNGGTLLIGALEKQKFEKFIKKPGSVLASLPTIGNWIISGVNWEYALVKNMDGYLLTLADLIKDHIGADASALISFKPTTYEERDIVLVEVPKGLNWYYLDGTQFYVRRSGSTISLDGPERERYQISAKS